jgi:hypothetical protein
VGTQTRGNETEPDVVVRGDRVYVAWQVDTGGDPNLFIVYRAFRRDGTPIMDHDRLWEPVQSGKNLSASAWMPRVAALPDGGFAIAGSWAAPGAKGFQVFVQRLTEAGEPVPFSPGGSTELIPVFADPDASQVFPALAADGLGRLFVAWSREQVDVDTRAFFTTLPPGAVQAEPSPPAPASPALASDAVALAAWPGTDGQALLAFMAGASDPDIVVRAALPADDTALRDTFGAKNQFDHTPTVVAREGGGVVAWYRVRSGIRNDLLVQGFTFDGKTLAKQGYETLLNPAVGDVDHAAAPYAVAMTPIGGGTVFLAWSEGKSPAFRLVGRFIRL